MVTFEDIKSYRTMTSALYALELERIEILNVLHSPSGKEYIGDARGSHVSDPTADTVRKLLDVEDQIEKQRAEVAQKIVEIRAYLDALPDQKVATMCKLRYIAGLPWRMVAIRMYYADGSSCRRKVLKYFGEYED